MVNTAKSTDWYEIGFTEGAEAGNSITVVHEVSFTPLEEMLALGHTMLNGRYATVRRRQIDFHSFEDVQSWLSGVIAGIGSVGARVGLQTTIEYPHSRSDGGATTYILVTRDVDHGAPH